MEGLGSRPELGALVEGTRVLCEAAILLPVVYEYQEVEGPSVQAHADTECLEQRSEERTARRAKGGCPVQLQDSF
jgi:hypothetical protein